MIKIRNLSKSFNEKKILNGISFEAFEGELIAVIGASGSGKTTLFQCLSLNERWDEGQYYYNGKDVLAMDFFSRWLLRRQWAYIGEEPDLNRNATAQRNVAAGRFSGLPLWRYFTRIKSTDDHYAIMDAIENIGLLDKAKKKVEHLSGGERRRVAVAKALVKGAKVIVADEPVSNLDPHSAESILADLQQLCHKKKVTIFASLHQVDLAEKYATRLLGLADGAIVFDVTGRRLTSMEKRMVFP